MAFDQPKYWISFGVGAVVMVLGGIPLLNLMGLIKWALPAYLVLPLNLLLWITAGIGFYLLIDSFISEQHMLRWVTALLAIVIMAVAILQILSIIKFISLDILRALFFIEGLGLVIAGIFGDF
jgi:hypothetical protein